MCRIEGDVNSTVPYANADVNVNATHIHKDFLQMFLWCGLWREDGVLSCGTWRLCGLVVRPAARRWCVVVWLLALMCVGGAARGA